MQSGGRKPISCERKLNVQVILTEWLSGFSKRFPSGWDPIVWVRRCGYDDLMLDTSLNSPATRPLTISDLTQHIKDVIETEIPPVWVVGEVSNFKAASSGHWYFSLKDDTAQIRATMWRSAAARAGMRPKDGMEVLVSGSLNVYPPRGEYSLVIDQIQDMGVGRLRQEFERLKKKLQDEGLFDSVHKKPLPLLPRKIGIVTSPTGAAIRDILRVLKHRFEGLHVLIAPARVQGVGAAEEIAVGIQYLDRFGDCDVIIVGRGGGSEEDLWAFNEEIVAKAIFEAETPIISAVGHEVDFTIADFVADIRAATPSNAAELAVRSRDSYQKAIDLAEQRLVRALQLRILALRQRVKLSESHPIFLKVRSKVNDVQRKLADLENVQQRSLERRIQSVKLRMIRTEDALDVRRLIKRLEGFSRRLFQAELDLDRLANEQITQARQAFASLVTRLDDLSPLRTLARGYSVVYNQKRQVLRSPNQVKVGEVLRVQMAEGELNVRALEPAERIEQGNLFD